MQARSDSNFGGMLAVLTLLLAQSPTTALAEPPGSTVNSAVTKILVHSNPPDLLSPWQKFGLESATGSGVIIDERRILTNAHVVVDAVSIEVKRAGMSRSFVAEVQYVGHGCDLALLTVEDDAFFEGVAPLPLGELPESQSEVQAYGFPIGGEKISVTAGILSRVEISTYFHSMEDMLLAQIDASINPGNSGGPIVADGKLVGIAVQTLDETENVGYMVPAPVIRHFLTDVEDGRYDGTPRFGAEWQDLESPAHRAYLGMSDGQTGALMSRIDHGSPAHGVLRTGDVLTKIGGRTVANDLTVERPGIGRVLAMDVYQSRQIGDELPISILRDGKSMDLTMTLTPHQFLVPGRFPDDDPQYLVFGGLVFQPLNYEYLMYFEDVPMDLANYTLNYNVTTEKKHQVILLQKVLPHAVNRGYQDWEDFVVDTVNGVSPRDMNHLAQIIDNAKGPWLRIVTDDVAVLTISLDKARAAQPKILEAFGITKDRSADLATAAASR